MLRDLWNDLRNHRRTCCQQAIDENLTRFYDKHGHETQMSFRSRDEAEEFVRWLYSDENPHHQEVGVAYVAQSFLPPPTEPDTYGQGFDWSVIWYTWDSGKREYDTWPVLRPFFEKQWKDLNDLANSLYRDPTTTAIAEKLWRIAERLRDYTLRVRA